MHQTARTFLSFSLILIAACVLDLIIGDPEWLPHPVRWIGRVISGLEGLLLKPAGAPARKKAAGAALAFIAAALAFGVSAGLLYAAFAFSPIFGREALGVVSELNNAGVEKARERLKRIVGRDTTGLPASSVCRAAAESVAENTSDGIVAPLFYLALGGPPLMLAYKAINTLDSMLGYKNERYMDFGWASARLDDAANFIPARVTALLMVISSFLLGLDWKRSIRIFLRDRKNHPSPNSGHPEAAVAGAIGVRFGGAASYGGVRAIKPYIGDDMAEAGPQAVLSSVWIMRITAFLMIMLAAFMSRAIFLL
ncbi:MAG: cobalamin biosynthesis protein CobD [Deltaproteobacteria bacterium]|nr:cobalamin biosynthesis protein CobD [Deltaproteobacteria bacterium]